MKKLLFAIIAATYLTCCSDYYYAEGRAERAFYAIDSTQCVVTGIFEEVISPLETRKRGASGRRKMYDRPPITSRAIVTSETTYYYKWQDANWQWEWDGEYIYVDTITNTAVALGDTICAYGTVRNITNLEGFSFQDIIIDSLEVIHN